jgi:hypothetical protein
LQQREQGKQRCKQPARRPVIANGVKQSMRVQGIALLRTSQLLAKNDAQKYSVHSINNKEMGGEIFIGIDFSRKTPDVSIAQIIGSVLFSYKSLLEIQVRHGSLPDRLAAS